MHTLEFITKNNAQRRIRCSAPAKIMHSVAFDAERRRTNQIVFRNCTNSLLFSLVSMILFTFVRSPSILRRPRNVFSISGIDATILAVIVKTLYPSIVSAVTFRLSQLCWFMLRCVSLLSYSSPTFFSRQRASQLQLFRPKTAAASSEKTTLPFSSSPPTLNPPYPKGRIRIIASLVSIGEFDRSLMYLNAFRACNNPGSPSARRRKSASASTFVAGVRWL